ncbi:MAG: hypothetical protein ACOH2A_13440 [Sphingobacteriaceae bacterium]
MEFIQSYFYLLIVAIIVLLVVTFMAMKSISKRFITMKPASRPFSIFSLQFPGSEAALTSLVNQIDAPVKRKIRQHLLVDFLFMLGVYPCIALLCYRVGLNIRADSLTGSYILIIVAVAQGVAWLFDIMENLILLRKIKNPMAGSEQLYHLYKWIVGLKFFIALTGVNSFLLVMGYIWITGNATKHITLLGAALAILLIIYLLVSSLKGRKRRLKQEKEMLLAQKA